MRVVLFYLLSALVLPTHVQEDEHRMSPKGGVTGVVRRHEVFSSKSVDARNVDVWLPPRYARDDSSRFPVIYMHDGQNLFDPALSFIGVDWGIDETMMQLINERQVREAIVVGVWNTPKRYAEYMPQKAVESAQAEQPFQIVGISVYLRSDEIISDNYVTFLVSELKPFIDETYRTLSNRENTVVMGSSMGGLISAYAISEYPEAFGGAGCISTHWPAGDGILIDYLKRRLPDPETHKFYFDYGTETKDATYEPYQQRMDEAMRAAGYEHGRNWLTRKHPGDEHSERAWSKRVRLPLIFLLGR
jgi:predicted alpha/beta superfamily hydrolase